MTPISILWYSWINALLSHYQGSFLMQHMGTNRKTHNQTICRDLWTFELLVLNSLVLLWDSRVWKQVGLYTYISFCAFFLGSFSSLSFVLFLSIVFVLSYYILFYYYPLEPCLFSNEGEKRYEFRWRGNGKSRKRGNGKGV